MDRIDLAQNYLHIPVSGQSPESGKTPEALQAQLDKANTDWSIAYYHDPASDETARAFDRRRELMTAIEFGQTAEAPRTDYEALYQGKAEGLFKRAGEVATVISAAAKFAVHSVIGR